MQEDRDETDERVRALVDRAVAGDQEAIDALYRIYENEMIGVAHARLGPTLGNLTESVDLVQSVWGDLLGDIGDFEYRGPGSFGSWLRTCLINKIHAKRKFLTAGKRDPRMLQRFADGEEPPGRPSDPTPSRAISSAEEAELLSRILERFPQPQRQVLLLRLRDEKSYSDIAREVDRSVEATKKLYQRGIERLIGELPDDWR